MFRDSVRKLLGKPLKRATNESPASAQQPEAADSVDAEKPDDSASSSVMTAVRARSGIRADLRYASWSSEGLVVSGWVTVGGKQRRAPQTLELFAKSLTGEATDHSDHCRRLEPFEPDSEHLEINSFVRSKHDLSTAIFTVLLPFSTWNDLNSDDLQIVARYGNSTELTPLTHRYRWGSAGHLAAQIVKPQRYAPRWDNDLGLCVSRTRPTVFISGMPDVDTRVNMKLEISQGYEPTTASFRQESTDTDVPLDLVVTEQGVSLSVPVSALPQSDGVWGITVCDQSGRRRLVHWADDRWDRLSITSNTYLEQRSGGALRLIRAEHPIIAEQVHFSDQQIVVALGEDTSSQVDSLILRGPRAELESKVAPDGQHTFDLAVSLWGQDVPVPPSGGYRVYARTLSGKEVPTRLSRSLNATTPQAARTSFAAFRLEHSPDNQLYVDISAPLTNDEKGLFNRRQLAARFCGTHASLTTMTTGGVFLESWYGKTFSDNPAPLVSALKDAGVAGPYHVVIADWSVSFPEDVHPVIAGSEEYWMALGTSRVVVFNTWLPSEFRKHPGQYVVQTWHGTPLKSLGMDVPHRRGSESAETNLSKGSAMWDLLVSQSSYATEIFRRAYVYDGEVAEVGYPRNDALCDADSSDLRRVVRSRLGLPNNSKVILYAPTWRQEDKGSVGPLDVPRLLELLPNDYFVAVRGHSVTLRRGSNVTGERIVDVTSYPEPSELMAMSDILVTDYSSIMFDFAASNRPILYYTPDLEEYVDHGRGAYFDLRDSAPGELTTTPTELANAIRTSPAEVTSSVYRVWQQKYVPYDDGHASERLARLISERLAEK